MTKEELDDWLSNNKRNLPNRAFIQDQTRASGLFIYDIAIDLRTLFCVSTNKLEPELFPEIETKLRESGWKESKNIFGNCLLCPEKERNEIINSLANSIINWRITSNQSRTFSLMETLALAISDNANKIAFSIRGELKDDYERPKASPVIDESSGANIFMTPLVSSIIPGFSGKADALDRAQNFIINYLDSYDFENQVFKK